MIETKKPLQLPATRPNRQGEAGEQMLARMNDHGPLTAWGSHFTWHGDEAVLDIGCGGGANLKRMSEHVTTGHLTGIDYSETSVRTSLQTNANAIEAGKMDVLKAPSKTPLPTTALIRSRPLKLLLLARSAEPEKSAAS